MDAVMTRRLAALARAMLLLVLISGTAAAQNTLPAPSAEPGRLWIVAGGSATTVLGDCTDCPADTYLHTGGVFGIVGKSLTPRTNAGLEVFWVPATSAGGDSIRTTYVMGSLQFRPWSSSGFFVRTSAGMAFVRNWIVTTETGSESFISKAFALEIGGGWEWRLAPRLGTQIFGAQHAAALGDLMTSTSKVENVMGNFWSVGAAIVIH
jgi:hypothetical protein